MESTPKSSQLDDSLLGIDKNHIWHPYSAIGSLNKIFHVESAKGCTLKLADGRELIDGMASWWSVIHGYNHPALNKALRDQSELMSHVMFGGLTHTPAIKLANKLIEITPPELQAVFFSDSGSVSVEVAMKMAIQYWHDQGQPKKQRFVSLKNGYHGDTFGAMSVCDPVTGMHSLFSETLTKQFFVPAPTSLPGQLCSQEDINNLESVVKQHADDVAAIILEPVVQGAGGMRFYSEDYLRHARRIADQYSVLLIFDEIATGFGRTGKLFALEHAEVTPDILCLGKALTGGYMTLAATIATRHISETISQGNPGVFMHGPTFMANPLACSVAYASLETLLASNWQENLQRLSTGLEAGLGHCRDLEHVKEVRVMGGIGVIELKEPVDMVSIQPKFVEEGVWVRPFGKLVYVMPPYIMTEDELDFLTKAICKVVEGITD